MKNAKIARELVQISKDLMAGAGEKRAASPLYDALLKKSKQIAGEEIDRQYKYTPAQKAELKEHLQESSSGQQDRNYSFSFISYCTNPALPKEDPGFFIPFGIRVKLFLKWRPEIREPSREYVEHVFHVLDLAKKKQGSMRSAADDLKSQIDAAAPKKPARKPTPVAPTNHKWEEWDDLTEQDAPTKVFHSLLHSKMLEKGHKPENLVSTDADREKIEDYLDMDPEDTKGLAGDTEDPAEAFRLGVAFMEANKPDHRDSANVMFDRARQLATGEEAAWMSM
jgi:hypothetical protein